MLMGTYQPTNQHHRATRRSRLPEAKRPQFSLLLLLLRLLFRSEAPYNIPLPSSFLLLLFFTFALLDVPHQVKIKKT